MRTETQAQRTRRKLRALARSRRAGSSVNRSSLNPVVANAVATAHAAYTLCARKTSAPNVAVAAQDAAASLVASFGIVTPRLGDRLRLEWLAAMPNADANLLAECARLLGDAIALCDASVSDRVRLASAEAYSLTQAVSQPSAMPVEAGWRTSPASVAFLSFGR